MDSIKQELFQAALIEAQNINFARPITRSVELTDWNGTQTISVTIPPTKGE